MFCCHIHISLFSFFFLLSFEIFFCTGVTAKMVVVYADYYFFFTNPPLIEVVVPGRLKMLEETSRIKLNPAEILDSPALKNLKIQVPELVPESAFNPNPFK